MATATPLKPSRLIPFEISGVPLASAQSSLLLVLCFAVKSLHADTYSYRIVYTEQAPIIACDDYGDYIMNLSNLLGSSCGAQASYCFGTYSVLTGKTAYTTFLPELPTDPHPIAGSGCDIDISLIPGGKSLCNNGHQIVGALGLFTGHGTNITQINTGQPLVSMLDGPFFMTANGNVYFEDGNNDWSVALINLDTTPAPVPVNVSTPEPSSLALLGTGVLGLIGAARRRFAA